MLPETEPRSPLTHGRGLSLWPPPVGGLAVSGDNIKPRKSPDPHRQHVGSRVRMRRIMLDMSQTTLGDGLGISFQQVQKYENGMNRIGASRLQHIAQILQVPVAFFFDGVPHVPAAHTSRNLPPSSDPLTDFTATCEGLALAKAFMRISNIQVRRRIVDLVERIEENQSRLRSPMPLCFPKIPSGFGFAS
jgi:transcriptional regulator with XRE-family HTH domain